MIVKSYFGGEPRMSIFRKDGKIRYHILIVYAMLVASLLSLFSKGIEQIEISSYISLYISSITSIVIIVSWVLMLIAETKVWLQQFLKDLRKELPSFQLEDRHVESIDFKSYKKPYIRLDKFQTLCVIRC
jgi:hypothetical protein